jgi:catechol 2,3-dioxygenase-like lactoylglutathione lyase family enzyme
VKVRFARKIADLKTARTFYEKIIGLKLLAEFEDHDGFSGLVFGSHAGGDWQVELVTKRETEAASCACELVLYCDRDEFDRISRRIVEDNIRTLRNENPYWETRGALTIADSDGNIVVVVPGDWRRPN